MWQWDAVFCCSHLWVPVIYSPRGSYVWFLNSRVYSVRFMHLGPVHHVIRLRPPPAPQHWRVGS
uniref:Uncharacterized protein n=1 Tax=Anguilla anguilla TaxID=7936 RepID=A0A0E9R648_ANGAN